ncbi:HAD phosphatase subfamily IIIA [Xenococcus sp. PCC 7305]|uniref:YqeG family HAD IIIA-type phosphatase n=1 Tax=Xenococcus sp. PCC 7305 TaxID=102125 RepID=UPI0002AC1D5F|nr:YqeG family HAD IIIA-type phosphatase [Xenococcus sp. PCC 7305]ELS03873.1 HAD phosphatase subfamily IIIA [Xenococcus sp. PCC 7305]
MSKRILLQPDLVLGGTITRLTPDTVARHNLKGLILDVDETLVSITTPQVSFELKQWTIAMKQIAKIWLVSNNLSKSRISAIANELDLPYFLGAKKPSRKKLRQAAEQMELPVAQVAMVGDRLFTDVLAGNRLGMFTILVEPMADPAILNPNHSIRNFEVWISQKLGVSLATQQHNVTNQNNS